MSGIPENIKEALFSLFGEKTVLDEVAHVVFHTKLRYKETMEQELQDLGATGVRVTRSEGGHATIRIPDYYMRHLNETYRMNVREDTGVMNEMLRQYRRERQHLFVEIPTTEQEDNHHALAEINRHFVFDPSIQGVAQSGKSPVTLGLTDYQTLLNAWQQVAPGDVSPDRRAREMLKRWGMDSGLPSGLAALAKGRPKPQHNEAINGDLVSVILNELIGHEDEALDSEAAPLGGAEPDQDQTPKGEAPGTTVSRHPSVTEPLEGDPLNVRRVDFRRRP